MKRSSQLAEAQTELALGVRLARQGSYERRAPDALAVPHLARARELLGNQDKNAEVLAMLSQIEECLLNYQAAVGYLERAIKVGLPRTKKVLKRLANLREQLVEWRDLGLTSEQLRALGDFLVGAGVGPANRSLHLTREWLARQSLHDPESVIRALGRRGAFSDFQVLANVVLG